MVKLNNKVITWMWRIWQKLVNIIGVTLLYIGIIIIGLQVFVYLLYGKWEELPLFYLPALLGPDAFMSWLDNPRSWLGLHKIVFGILKFMPLSLFLMLVGVPLSLYYVRKQNI
ncbi:MAG: hypothetical protein L0Y56_16390 [Nitrospira sp.]|nr:hypothetical protein [Nitrospira sp.]